MARKPRKRLTSDMLADAYHALAQAALRAAQKALYRPDEYEDAKDAASEALFALAVKLAAGEAIDDAEAFVARVAKRRAADIVRRKQRWQTLVARRVVGEKEGGALDSAETGVVAQRLLDAVDQLPEGQRLCFEWYYLGRMSVEEIAVTLGITVGAVKSQLSRARTAVGQEIL